ncbi:hypothetical protein EHQ43_18585 [Leptospira bouyouniensis]|uniref:Uncharacterized protein n=1 Tax=Leptospira bouyouniensis TaxID=2484911 RepID=A0A7I0HMH6_9LEPT|nr:hypothetical protein [Leptospira bouyouniensis]TGL01910.1 hypothetical protein EHQ43_18585 [Leptospira bouyouniensis]
MKLKLPIYIILICSLFILSECIIIRNNKINEPSLKNLIDSNKIGITLTLNGCFPDDLTPCNYSTKNYALLIKHLIKSSMISDINGSSKDLKKSDYIIDFYWKENIRSFHDILTEMVSVFSIGLIPTYRNYKITLVAIIKSNTGRILKTIEFSESFLEVRHLFLAYKWWFNNEDKNETIKSNMIDLLLQDIAEVNE